MQITPATAGDLEILIAFRDEASHWLRARGIDQWSRPWPSTDLMAEGMLRNIEAGETFIVWDDGTPAATITVDRWANPDLWTPAEAAEPALYAHKVTVARAYAGRGLGAELLDWAGTRAADNRATWLRLDVWTTNYELQRYYLEQGFTHVRTVALSHNPSGALFQRLARRVPTPRLQESRVQAR
jgi:GNAT superfamily N-acetyltransferase